MTCPDCLCTKPRCSGGCVHTWRERAAWWTSAAFWRRIRATVHAAVLHTPHWQKHHYTSGMSRKHG